ncbi:MAG: hypothetical protein WD335_03725 [Candidatus Paceibacterota bacterium]
MNNVHVLNVIPSHKYDYLTLQILAAGTKEEMERLEKELKPLILEDAYHLVVSEIPSNPTVREVKNKLHKSVVK